MQGKRKDLERMSAIMMKVKNPPIMQEEGEVSMATDATKLEKGGDRYGEFKSMKVKRSDGKTVSADMSTATKDKLPELTITA